VLLASSVTWLFGPPPWLVVHCVRLTGPLGGLGAGAGGALDDGSELGVGLEEGDAGADGLGEALGSELGEELGVGVADADGEELGDALGDGLEEAGMEARTGEDTGLGVVTGPAWTAQCTRTVSDGHWGALTDTPESFPEARQAYTSTLWVVAAAGPDFACQCTRSDSVGQLG
jgi:hypothetical protein